MVCGCGIVVGIMAMIVYLDQFIPLDRTYEQYDKLQNE